MGLLAGGGSFLFGQLWQQPGLMGTTRQGENQKWYQTPFITKHVNDSIQQFLYSSHNFN